MKEQWIKQCKKKKKKKKRKKKKKVKGRKTNLKGNDRKGVKTEKKKINKVENKTLV
jgi:hypothetical protein